MKLRNISYKQYTQRKLTVESFPEYQLKSFTQWFQALVRVIDNIRAQSECHDMTYHREVLVSKTDTYARMHAHTQI